MHYLNTNLTDLYPKELWTDLIERIKDLPCFRPFIKADDYKVYLIKDFSIDSPKASDLITIKIRNDNYVSMEILYKRDLLIKDFYDLMINSPSYQVALFLNNEKNLIKRIVRWRLENGI